MQRRFTPRRAWAPLSDAEWALLGPHLPRAEGNGGRPLRAPRARLDAMLRIAVSGDPWRVLAEDGGKPDTASRLFRRWARAGVWTRLLAAVAAPDAPPALRAMEYWLCRLARRAMRLLGMGGLALANRLGLLTALPMLPWLLPMPDLSEAVFRHVDEVFARLPYERPPPGLLAKLGRLLRIAGGRPVWSKKFAPP